MKSHGINTRALRATGSRLAMILAIAFAVAGCAPTVKLDEPAPVSDVKAVPVGSATTAPPAVAASAAQPTAAVTAPTNTRDVTPVNAQPVATQNEPPQGLARTVYFDYDSFQIKPEFQTVLEGHAKYLKANTARRLNLEGHTDERGGREYNLALGQRRAEAVTRAMRLLGVNDAQTEAVSFGKEKPANTGNDEAAWAKNRRVELFYK